MQRKNAGNRGKIRNFSRADHIASPKDTPDGTVLILIVVFVHFAQFLCSFFYLLHFIFTTQPLAFVPNACYSIGKTNLLFIFLSLICGKPRIDWSSIRGFSFDCKMGFCYNNKKSVPVRRNLP